MVMSPSAAFPNELCCALFLIFTGLDGSSAKPQHSAGSEGKPCLRFSRARGTREDRTVCFAPAAMGTRQQSQCGPEVGSVWPLADVFRGIFPGERGWLQSESPKVEQNPSFPRRLQQQNCSLVYVYPSLVITAHGCMHTAMERPRNHEGPVLFTTRYFPSFLRFFQSSSNSWCCP